MLGRIQGGEAILRGNLPPQNLKEGKKKGKTRKRRRKKEAKFRRTSRAMWLKLICCNISEGQSHRQERRSQHYLIATRSDY